MGRYERVLTIDGEYIHLMTSESKKLLDLTAKTVRLWKREKERFACLESLFNPLSFSKASYHISAVMSCKQNKKKNQQFRLDIQKNHDVRNLDLEAASPMEAGRIIFLGGGGREYEADAFINFII